MLRLVNGGEYVSNEFNEFGIKYEIKNKFTILFTSQQKGVLERKIRIFMKMARCMLGNLPSFLRGKFMSTIIYILNRCPMKDIEVKIPYEVWMGKKPNISNLRVFGYESFSYIISRK